MSRVLGWHFTNKALRDGSPIPKVGKWLRMDGDIVICERGLHFSRDPWQALEYAPQDVCYLHRVEVRGIVTEHTDKGVARERKIIASRECTEALYYFARMQALSVVHLWDAPDVALDYLTTGDESARAAAWDAAWAAARAAARAAAWAAAWDAARAAAGDAAWAAAWDAAGDDFRALVAEAFEGVE